MCQFLRIHHIVFTVNGITDTLFHNNYTVLLNGLTCSKTNVLNSKCVIIYLSNNYPNNCETSVAWLYWAS